MNRAISQLIGFQFKNFFRTPGIIFWAILFPILMAWVLGIAFTQGGPQQKTIYWVSQDEGPFQKKTDLEPSGTSEVVTGEDLQIPASLIFVPATEAEALQALRRGETSLYFVETADSIIYFFDPLNPDAQNTYLLLEKYLHQTTGSPTEEVRPITSRGNRYIDFLIPGLIALGIMNTCMWGISWNLIEYRMKKLLRRMVATPMKKTDFLISLFITRFVIGAFEASVLFVFATFYFDVRLQGSFIAFFLLFSAGVVAFSGIAVAIASRSASSQVGNGLINAVVLPMTILSGIFFSYQNFPEWALPVIKVLPLTLLADGIRGVFIEGHGIVEASLSIIILSITGIFFFILGLKLFRWY